MTDIPHHWLNEKRTPEEFERAQLERMAAGFNVPLEKIQQKFAARPFGNMTAAWRAFVAEMAPDDELWSFSSPAGTWAKKLGRSGFAIVRGRTIRNALIMLEN